MPPQFGHQHNKQVFSTGTSGRPDVPRFPVNLRDGISLMAEINMNEALLLVLHRLRDAHFNKAELEIVRQAEKVLEDYVRGMSQVVTGIIHRRGLN